MSKFSLDVLNKFVFPNLETQDSDVILGAAFGEDVALTRVGSDILASHLDPIVGAVTDIGWLAVHVACNDIATTGAPPRWIQVLVLVPHQEDVDLIQNIMQDVRRAADEIGVSVIGGHTGYSSSLTRPLVAVTALGTLSGKTPVLTSGATPGDQIIVTKGVALEGTAILANDFSKAAFDLGLSEMDLIDARKLFNQVSVIPEAIILGENGASAMHYVTRGGLLETLLEMANLSNVGISIAYDSIPIPDVVARFATVFQFDPLKMISSGTLVATVPVEKLDSAKQHLEAGGIQFGVIGEVCHGSGVKIKKGSQILDFQAIKCEEDELARMWTMHTVDNAS